MPGAKNLTLAQEGERLCGEAADHVTLWLARATRLLKDGSGEELIRLLQEGKDIAKSASRTIDMARLSAKKVGAWLTLKGM